MKKFLAVYIGTPDKLESSWNKLSESEKKQRSDQGMQSWGAWADKNKNRIKDGGAPLGKTKRVDKGGVSDIKNAMTGYTIIEAETHEEAAKIFLNHPHFAVFPGEAVEIMECLAIPMG